MKSELLPLAKHRSNQGHVRGLRADRNHRRQTETKTPRRPAADKSRCRDGKSADRPIPLRLRDSQGCLPRRDETECRNEICNRKRARPRQKERRLRPQNKDFPATNTLHVPVVPSISQRTAARRRALCGGNCWGCNCAKLLIGRWLWKQY